jgi:assimilatory nitrate reductase catalytic subunit
MQAVADGQIKGLWVIATNTAHSWIDSTNANELLQKLDFLVVQDMFATTDTARQAHLVLPAAGWGEKEGTFINSERRFGHIKKVSRAPGEALSDFNIFRLVAEYWGCSNMFSQWTSPQAVFQILKKLSAGRPCDFTGITNYRHIDASGGIQWPWPSSPGAGSPLSGQHRERRLFEDGKFHTTDGKARFMFDAPRPVAEPSDETFPLVLMSGRGTSAQWHTNTRTEKSAVLRSLYPANPYVEINPVDAAKIGITASSTVAIISRRARIECTAHVTRIVQPGHVFIPMHYAITNKLTRPDFDPHSRQPSYKHCAVRIEKVR